MLTFKPALLSLILFAIILGCAGSVSQNSRHKSVADNANQDDKEESALRNSLDLLACSADDFRGTGIDLTESEALLKARSAIALQINAKITVAEEIRLKQRVENGAGNLQSSFSSHIEHNSELLNAQDAKVRHSKRLNNRVGVVACMSRVDAAKPFIELERLLIDSLSMSIKTELSTDHPLRKNEAFRTANNIYSRLLSSQIIVEGLDPNNAASSDYFAIIDSNYRKMRDDYENFRSRYAFSWSEAGGNGAGIVFSKLSSRYKLSTRTCLGLHLTFRDSEHRCESKGFGVSCIYELSLEGSSCANETYFSLQARVITTGRYEEEAIRKLWAKLPNEQFWNNWLPELDKWSIK